MRIREHYQVLPLPTESMEQGNQVWSLMHHEFVLDRHVQGVGLKETSLKGGEDCYPAGVA